MANRPFIRKSSLVMLHALSDITSCFLWLLFPYLFSFLHPLIFKLLYNLSCYSCKNNKIWVWGFIQSKNICPLLAYSGNLHLILLPMYLGIYLPSYCFSFITYFWFLCLSFLQNFLMSQIFLLFFPPYFVHYKAFFFFYSFSHFPRYYKIHCWVIRT